jgi:hypothetical protein
VKGPVLFLAEDGAGRRRLVAALAESGPGAFGVEGGRARLELVPELGSVANQDPRGRRVDLGRLLAPHLIAAEAGDALPVALADLAAHLIELPALGTPAAWDVRHQVRIRGLDSAPQGLQPLWPVPGGFLEIDSRAVDWRAAGVERAALWTCPLAPGGPDLRLLGAPEPALAGLLAVLREAGLGGLEGGPNGFLPEWLLRAREAGGAGLEATGAFSARRGLAQLLRRVLLEGSGQAGELALPSGTVRARVSAQRRAEGLIWLFELELAPSSARFELRSVGFEPAALVALARAPDPLAPHRLLLFRSRGERGLHLEQCLDPRGFLLSHPEAWAGGQSR